MSCGVAGGSEMKWTIEKMWYGGLLVLIIPAIFAFGALIVLDMIGFFKCGG
jgi:hypothetical protein